MLKFISHEKPGNCSRLVSLGATATTWLEIVELISEDSWSLLLL